MNKKNRRLNDLSMSETLELTEDGRFKAIESGAKFPPATPIFEGLCECCDRGNSIVAMMEEKFISSHKPAEYIVVCAECFADFTAGASLYCNINYTLVARA